MKVAGWAALVIALVSGLAHGQRIIKRPTSSLQPKSSSERAPAKKTEFSKENVLTDIKMVCYYSNWAVYRPGLAKFTPQNINPFLCSHLIYAFAGFNKKWEMKPFDPYNDIEQGNYKKFVGLKQYNPALKTMVAVGGWNEGSKRFTEMVEDAGNRQAFVRSSVKFCRTHGFDGLDLDWEYPTFRDGGRPEDREGYALLIKELREAFDAEKTNGKDRLLLSVAVPAGKDYIDQGFDIKTISKFADFLNILTYDYHTAFEPTTNHHAPLKARSDVKEWDDENALNVDWTINYYLEKGAPAKKLILGIPTYGRSYTLTNADDTDLDAPADGPGEQGEATREKGYLAYYEICQAVNEKGWELSRPHEDIMGPVAFKGTQWVGFDDEIMIANKVKYIKDKGLGGAMVWTLDNDDFRGSCGGGESPLISALREHLLEAESSSTKQKTSSTTEAKKESSRSGRTKTATTTKAPKETGLLFTTPEPPTTPDPGMPFECEDEGFFPNEKDCRKYYWCLDSGPADLGIVAHTFTCPSNLHFNPKTESCDFKERVKCKGDKSKKKSKSKSKAVTSTAEPEEQETTTTTTAKPSSSSKRSKSRTSSRTTVRSTTSTTTTTTTTPGPTTALKPLSTKRKTNSRRKISTTTPAPVEEDEDYDEVDQTLDPTEKPSSGTRRQQKKQETKKDDSIAELVKLLKDHLKDNRNDETSQRASQVRGLPAQIGYQTQSGLQAQAFIEPQQSPADPGTNIRRPAQAQYREPESLFQQYANPSGRQAQSDAGLNVYVAPIRQARPPPEDAISPFQFSYADPQNRPVVENHREPRQGPNVQNIAPPAQESEADLSSNSRKNRKKKPQLDNPLARAPYNDDRFDLGGVPSFGFSEGTDRSLPEEKPVAKAVTAAAPARNDEPEFVFDEPVPSFAFADVQSGGKPKETSRSTSSAFLYNTPDRSTSSTRRTTESPFDATPQRQSRPPSQSAAADERSSSRQPIQFDYQTPQRDTRPQAPTFTYNDPPPRESRPRDNTFTYNDPPQRSSASFDDRLDRTTPQAAVRQQTSPQFEYQTPARLPQAAAFNYEPPQRKVPQDLPASSFNYEAPQRSVAPQNPSTSSFNYDGPQRVTQQQFRYDSPQRSPTNPSRAVALDTLVPDPNSGHDEGRNVRLRKVAQGSTAPFTVAATAPTTPAPRATTALPPPLDDDDDEYYYDDYEDVTVPSISRPTAPPQQAPRATVATSTTRPYVAVTYRPVTQPTYRPDPPTSPRRAVVITTPRPSRRPVVVTEEPTNDPYAPPLIVIDKDTVDCNKRGVFIHPNDCTKFVVCAPGKNGLKGFVHNCPADTIYVTSLGRCLRGNRNTCTRK